MIAQTVFPLERGLTNTQRHTQSQMHRSTAGVANEPFIISLIAAVQAVRCQAVIED